ncbi:MAG: hypothetical protein ACTSV1_10255 [Alphaproteobacteria bacterium]
MSFFALLVLAACTFAPPVAAVEGSTAVITGKPLSDYLVSYASGKNCSTSRTNAGLTYCEEDEVNAAPKVWCYRTIGRVSCYDRPDPLNGNQRKVGVNDHNVKPTQ